MPKKLLLLAFLSLPLASAHADSNPTPPAVQLADKYENVADITEYLVSEKLDGVRGRWTGEVLLTRGGHTVRTPAWFTAGWPDVPLDGELWMGRRRFDAVSGIVRSTQPDEDSWRQVNFMVFDLPASAAPFSERTRQIRELLAAARIEWLQPVEQIRVDNARKLDEWLAYVVAEGGEGLMLHHQDARYQSGRSEHLLKYKPFDDAEARVIDYIAGKGKYSGMTGALLVERADGVRFRVGSGLDDADRADPPSIGSWITYRYTGLTLNGLPRFPRFLRVREELPPPE